MKTRRIIVVGAGIGGITAAIHLAKQGYKVTVIEKNSRPGGRCDRISRDGHHFDTGPTLMVMPLLYESEFSALGTSMYEVLDLIRVDPTYHLVFDDGSKLALTSDMKSMSEQLEKIEPGSFQGLLHYLDEGSRHYHLSVEKLVNPDFRKATEFFKLDHLPLIYLVKPFKKNLNKKKQRMRDAIDAYSKLVDYQVGDVTAAATYYIAEIYYQFSHALINSERPDNLNAEELEQYELVIEDQAYPFEEKAINVHEKNLELLDAGVYNEWVDRSLAKLARLVPARYVT